MHEPFFRSGRARPKVTVKFKLTARFNELGGSLRPSDGTERTRKKEGREHGIERWWLLIFQEEGRHQKFITHGAKGLMKEITCQIRRFCVHIPHEKVFYLKAQDWDQSPCILAWEMFGPSEHLRGFLLTHSNRSTSFWCWGHRPWCNTRSGGLKKVE